MEELINEVLKNPQTIEFYLLDEGYKEKISFKEAESYLETLKEKVAEDKLLQMARDLREKGSCSKYFDYELGV